MDKIEKLFYVKGASLKEDNFYKAKAKSSAFKSKKEAIRFGQWILENCTPDYDCHGDLVYLYNQDYWNVDELYGFYLFNYR